MAIFSASQIAQVLIEMPVMWGDIEGRPLPALPGGRSYTSHIWIAWETAKISVAQMGSSGSPVLPMASIPAAITGILAMKFGPSFVQAQGHVHGVPDVVVAARIVLDGHEAHAPAASIVEGRNMSMMRAAVRWYTRSPPGRCPSPPAPPDRPPREGTPPPLQQLGAVGGIGRAAHGAGLEATPGVFGRGVI